MGKIENENHYSRKTLTITRHQIVGFIVGGNGCFCFILNFRTRVCFSILERLIDWKIHTYESTRKLVIMILQWRKKLEFAMYLGTSERSKTNRALIMEGGILVSWKQRTMGIQFAIILNHTVLLKT